MAASKKTIKPGNAGVSGMSPGAPGVESLISPDSVIHFPKGVPAFESATRFVLQLSEKIRPFIYMKSLDVEGLGFVCIDPFAICPDYDVTLSQDTVAALGLSRPESALLLSFVTVAPDPMDSTANLMGPVVINTERLVGCQVIFEQYPVRYKIRQAIEGHTDKTAGR